MVDFLFALLVIPASFQCHAESKFCHGPSLRDQILATTTVTNRLNQAGFNPIDSVACRDQAKKARASVFRLMLPGNDKVPIETLVGEDSEPSRLKLLKAIRDDRTPPPSTNPLNEWEIQRCLIEHAVRCYLSTDYHSSTLVLVGDGRKAMTALHTLMEENARKEITADTILPAFVFDWAGNLVGDPSTLKIHIGKAFSPEQKLALDPASNTQTIATPFDHVTLDLSRRLGPGLKIASAKQRGPEKLRLFGFPDETKEWQKFGAIDSDGSSMSCSVGERIEIDAAARKLSWDLKTVSPQILHAYQNSALFTDSASFHGMSGGAVLNSAGELVAIHTSGNNVPANPVSANALIFEKDREP